ncbi:uncharacterized protein N7459_001336 [Penicillium hispanicum]|uniref:uncharacterized protein n=1 Tax=Penicillium hispanicum TaxID=1080232 RepID=UPI00253FB97D|nr:uncharacterized protein N7459_001336 [Penicillium hispanicum]KAJ5595128.1 hypothetical protein N7459_001336 [Penicillium hispanicum]
MAQIKGLNAQDRPPDVVHRCYKKYSSIPLSDIDNDPNILDLWRLDPDSLPPGLTLSQYISSQDLRLAFDDFTHGAHAPDKEHAPMTENIPVFTHDAIPGFAMIPFLFPPTIQVEMLSRLLHRDLPNPRHQTNLHLHWNVTYPEETEDCTGVQSFFADDPTRLLYPKDPQAHEPLSVQNALETKLRWITLGSEDEQIDSAEPLSSFPLDIAKVLQAAFPKAQARAASLNLHSAGDTLSAHRETGEKGEPGLISVRFGCDSLLMVSHGDGNGCEMIRLRSGDAVFMNGTSRSAWHAVPRILPSTCPNWLAGWPVLGEHTPGSPPSPYRMWRGWISGKQIALNVQQKTDSLVS